MTDIVDRLRAEYREWGEAFHAEAADEIEKLRAALRKAADMALHDELSKRTAADEIERLRKLLAANERDMELALAALDHHLRVDR